MTLGSFTTSDIIALTLFVVAWAGYSLAIERTPIAKRTLSAAMDRQRRAWVEAMIARDNRIADTNILAGLQTGTGFFASASMLAIGACLALIGQGEAVSSVITTLNTPDVPTGAPFEVKMAGLAILFIYAFFKFGWAYRLFNYASISIGALPPPSARGTPDADRAVSRAATLLRLAGRNFNRGQRAFHFSLAYLGWLAGPWVLAAATALVLAVVLHRQLWSLSARTVKDV